MSDAVPGLLVLWSGTAPRREVHRIRAVPEHEWGVVLGRELIDATTDDRISRRHVGVRVDGRSATLQDLGSRNGTLVDGRELERGGAPVRAWLPVVVRAGRTVAVVVPDVRPYEELVLSPEDEGAGAMVAAARAEVDAAARAEENLTIAGQRSLGLELARRYTKVICGDAGERGETVEFDPTYGGTLDGQLAGRRPRAVILVLVESALSFADLATLRAWIETDVRFVTVMMPNTTPLSMLGDEAIASLRRRVIEVWPRFEWITTRAMEIVREIAPDVRVHATVIEALLLGASKFDEAKLFEQLGTSVARWLADRARVDETVVQPSTTFRGTDLLPFEPEGMYAIQGIQVAPGRRI